MQFRKKPVVIEAVQWDGTEAGCQRIKAHFPGLETLSKTGNLYRPEVDHWRIGTLEGGHDVSPGDWIIRGVKGEHYPCKPDIFAMTYEPAAARAERAEAAQPEVPAAVWEALQRLIENGAALGPGSSEDALLVARYRKHLLATRPAEAAQRVPLTWPKGREAGRIGDMAPPENTHMRVGLDASNDVYVAIWDNDGGKAQSASIEFCTGMGGGGQSPRTREALIALMVAMEADSAESPGKAFPPAPTASPTATEPKGEQP